MTKDPRAPTGERIDTIDIIRGVALCGLPLLNVLDFGFVEDLYFSPGSLQGVDYALWTVLALFGAGKFMALFSILFGAGIILSTERRDAMGEPVAKAYLSRLGWLFFFGLLHAYLIWHGDILVGYATTAFVLFWIRKWSGTVLTAIGGVLLSVFPAACALSGLILLVLQVDTSAWADPNLGWSESESAALRGSWLEQMPVRSLYAFILQLLGIPFLVFWIAGGFMCLGMALMKNGFLRGSWPRDRYRRWAVWCSAIGIGLSAVNHVLTHELLSPLSIDLMMLPISFAGTAALALGYAGAIWYWCSGETRSWLHNSLAAMGRMAFTNYIGQSIILSLIFYGHGLGLQGQLRLPVVLLIMPGIWLLQSLYSRAWLSRFQFGPLEWLWRSLTYGRRLPIVRSSSGSFRPNA